MRTVFEFWEVERDGKEREDTAVGTYAHVTRRMRSSAGSKVRGFFRADAIAAEAGLATPGVDTGPRSIVTPVTPL